MVPPWTGARKSTPDLDLDVSNGFGDLCAQAESILRGGGVGLLMSISCLSQRSMQFHRKENKLVTTLSF